MLKIGEFSKFGQVSVKALRHYDELGLLAPARIDRFTGYRYYALDQLPRLNRILAFKDLGFSLDEMATNVPLGRHWLSVLSQNGHAGAQAFFADLLWRGKHVEPDPARALALIAVAVDNAPSQDAMWIEDIYQNIFCGAAEGTRKQATGIVAQWGNRYGRKPAASYDRSGLPQLTAAPIRTCKNGEPVDMIRTRSQSMSTERLPAVRSFNYGTMAGPPPQLRDVNVPGPKVVAPAATPAPVQ